MAVDRVSTFMQSQAMLNAFQRAQKSLFAAQEQYQTGKKINEFSDEPGQIGALLSTRASDARVADFEATAKILKQRLDIQDTHMDELSDIAAAMKQSVMDAVANGDASGLKQEMQNAFDRFTSILNTQVDGKYIYGGTRQDVPPVTATTIGQLLALPAVGDAFQNNQIASSAKIDTNQTLAFGQFADALGAPALDMIRQFMAFDAGPTGNFGGDLTEDQKTFLSGMIPGLNAVADGALARLAENGVAYRAASEAVTRHGDTRVTLAGILGDIENVDMAEAIVKVNNAQLALDASARTFTMVQSVSLLNYL